MASKGNINPGPQTARLFKLKQERCGMIYSRSTNSVSAEARPRRMDQVGLG